MVIATSLVTWGLLALTAAVFLLAGFNHGFRTREPEAIEQAPWMADLPVWQVRAIGVLEILGALGLVLPFVTGTLPWVTPLAGVCLALLMVAALIFHARRDELNVTPINLVLGGLAAAAAWMAYGSL